MTTTTTMSALDLAAALRDGSATVEAPASVAYDEGDCVNSGAAWPAFDLVIQYDGWELSVPTWYVCHWDRRGRWAVTTDDGQFRGFRLPQVREDDDGGYIVAICGGDNLADHVADLDAGDDLAAAEAAAEAIGDALQSAYDGVAVPEPDLDELDENDVPRFAWIGMSSVLGIEIGAALHPILRDDNRDDDYEGGAAGVAWIVRGLPPLAGEHYNTREEAEAAVRETLPAAIADLPYLRSVSVDVADSLAAGNCRQETDRAAEIIRARRGLDADDEITVKDVLAVMPDSDAARRACAIAALRQ